MSDSTSDEALLDEAARALRLETGPRLETGQRSETAQSVADEEVATATLDAILASLKSEALLDEATGAYREASDLTGSEAATLESIFATLAADKEGEVGGGAFEEAAPTEFQAGEPPAAESRAPSPRSLRQRFVASPWAAAAAIVFALAIPSAYAWYRVTLGAPASDTGLATESPDPVEGAAARREGRHHEDIEHTTLEETGADERSEIGAHGEVRPQEHVETPEALAALTRPARAPSPIEPQDPSPRVSPRGNSGSRRSSAAEPPRVRTMTPEPAPAPTHAEPELATDPPVDQDRLEAEENAAFALAHREHFSSARSMGAALQAWNAYLTAYPNGRYQLEAHYNRALLWIRMGRHNLARRALQPFASGAHGSYRQAEARQLIAALENPAVDDPSHPEADENAD